MKEKKTKKEKKEEKETDRTLFAQAYADANSIVNEMLAEDAALLDINKITNKVLEAGCKKKKEAKKKKSYSHIQKKKKK